MFKELIPSHKNPSLRKGGYKIYMSGFYPLILKILLLPHPSFLTEKFLENSFKNLVSVV